MDLGVAETVCMALPDTCGAAGGAVALWMRITEPDLHFGGIMSSLSSGNFTAYLRILQYNSGIE